MVVQSNPGLTPTIFDFFLTFVANLHYKIAANWRNITKLKIFQFWSALTRPRVKECQSDNSFSNHFIIISKYPCIHPSIACRWNQRLSSKGFQVMHSVMLLLHGYDLIKTTHKNSIYRQDFSSYLCSRLFWWTPLQNIYWTFCKLWGVNTNAHVDPNLNSALALSEAMPPFITIPFFKRKYNLSLNN